MLTRIALVAVLSCCAVPVAAQSKDEVCGLQGEVVGAIQQARLDRVKREEVVPTLVGANPGWERMSDAMPQMIEWVYSLKRRDLRNADLGVAAETQCLDNWEQIQALTNN